MADTDTDPITRATNQGATFERKPDGTWLAIARKRGRAQPLATFNDPSQTECAAMYLRYFSTPRHHPTKEHG